MGSNLRRSRGINIVSKTTQKRLIPETFARLGPQLEGTRKGHAEAKGSQKTTRKRSRNKTGKTRIKDKERTRDRGRTGGSSLGHWLHAVDPDDGW